MDVHAGKSRIEKPSTTMARASTSQAIGGGSGLPLTGRAEGEEIVCAHVKA